MCADELAATGPGSEARDALVTLAELVDDGVVVSDARGVVVHVNAGFERLTARSRAELVGANVGDVIGDQPDPERPTVRHPVGAARPCLVRTASVGQHVLTVCRSMPAAVDAATSRRLNDLETVVRNIAWELKTLDRRSDDDAGELAAGLTSLSRRERDALDAYLVALSVTDAAARLHVSVHTVRSHLKAVYRKLGVRSKTELVQVVGRPRDSRD